MLIFLFDRKTYGETATDRTNPLNIFKWNKEMCEKEFELNQDIGDSTSVLRIDTEVEDDLAAIEYDLNESENFNNIYIIRMFN